MTILFALHIPQGYLVVYLINEPRHAEGVELFIKELHAQLTGQQRHVLNDGQPVMMI